MILTTYELAKATGATYRQIHYWAYEGYIDCLNPRSGSGIPMEFSDEIIPAVKVAVRVSKAFSRTIPQGLIKRVFDNFDVGFIVLGEGVTLEWEKE